MANLRGGSQHGDPCWVARPYVAKHPIGHSMALYIPPLGINHCENSVVGFPPKITKAKESFGQEAVRLRRVPALAMV